MTKGLYLGEFEQMVLLAVIRLDGNAYGVTIRDEIERRGQRDVIIGAVYAALDRLERKGYARSSVTAPTPVRGGRARKVFRASEAGRRALAAARAMMDRMADGLVVDRGRRT